MIETFTLEPHHAAFIKEQLATGRYADASAVLHEALTLLEGRRCLESEIGKSVERGLADVAAGRVHDLEEVFAEVEADFSSMPPN